MKKWKKISTILCIIAILATITLIKIIPIKNNKIHKCTPNPTWIHFYCSYAYEPVCWDDNETYQNSCIACHIWWKKYYTEWECWKSQKISIIQLLINQLKACQKAKRKKPKKF